MQSWPSVTTDVEIMRAPSQRLRQLGKTPEHENVTCTFAPIAKGHINDSKLLELTVGMEDNVNAANALIMRARALESSVTHEQVWRMAEGFANRADVVKYDVSLANLLHNAARFFHDKPRDRRDLKFALGLIDVAIAHYGDVSNWHHRAAAHFWKSHILEKLTAIPDAFAAASRSLHLWYCQYALEKDTAPFGKKLENAQVRLAELSLKLVEFARRAHA